MKVKLGEFLNKFARFRGAFKKARRSAAVMTKNHYTINKSYSYNLNIIRHRKIQASFVDALLEQFHV